MLYASFGFLFYSFDVAWVFQRDFFTGADAGVGPAYALIMSLLMVLAGCASRPRNRTPATKTT